MRVRSYLVVMRLALLLLLLPGFALAEPATAEDILRMATEGREFSSSVQALTLDQYKGDELAQTVRVRSWVKEADDGTRMARMEVSAPRDYEGMRLLTLEPAIGSSEEGASWILFPGQDKAQAGSAASRRSAFLKTDFAMEDMRLDEFDRGTHTLTGEEWLRIDGKDRKVWVIEIVPDPDADSAYTKVIAKIDQEALLPRKVLLHGKKGRQIKELTVLRTETVGGVTLPVEAEMKDLRRGTRTVLHITGIELDVPDARLPDSFFTAESLPLPHK